METKPSNSPAAVAAADRGWVILDDYGHLRDSLRAQANTVAYARTSTGKCIRASFRLAAPPGNSALYVHCLDLPVPDDQVLERPELIAAHGDAVLFRTRDLRDSYNCGPFEHFVYRSGGPSRPPSLSLLPHCYLPMSYERDSHQRIGRRQERRMASEGTGVLHGGDELVVAELDSWRGEHELCVLRLGPVNDGLEWEIKPVPSAGVPGSWHSDAVVPIGDRFLCWVDYYVGLVLCNVLDANPVHRYVPLPPAAALVRPRDYRDRLPIKQSRTLGVTAGGAVKLVTIEPRCCCGDVVKPWSNCHRSRFSFSVTTYTLNVDDGMTWTEDGVLFSDELWALPGCKLLPRVEAEYPVVSTDEPDAVCLMLRSEQRHLIDIEDDDQRIWMIEVDTRKKTLRSVVRYASNRKGDDDDASMTDYFGTSGFFPSEISRYLLNSSTSSTVL